MELGKWGITKYGGLAFVLGMPTLPLLIYLPIIYAEHVGLSLSVIGMSLFISKILDVVSDPLIGILSDRIDSRWGRRKPLIVIGAIIASVATLPLLDPSKDAGPWHLLFWA